MSFYKVSALSVLAISLAACSSSGDKTDSQPTTTIPSATTGSTGSTNTGNTGTTTPAPTTPTTPVTQPTVLVPAPTAPTGKALEAANKAKILPVPKAPGGGILRPAKFDDRTTPYTNNDKTYTSGEFVIPSTEFAQGFSERTRNYAIRKDNANYDIRSVDRVYNQNYSIIYGTNFSEATYNRSGKTRTDGSLDYTACLKGENCAYSSFRINTVQGVQTTKEDIPTLGKATYTGTAFSGTGKGSLIYNVDFGAKKGSGELTVSDIGGKVILKETEVRSGVVVGDVSLSNSTKAGGSYNLSFYGPKAAEIAGSVHIDRYHYYDNAINAPYNGSWQTEIGFGGTRGAITK